MGKTVACNYCKQPVATNAKLCPHCGGRAPAFQAWQKWAWFWGGIAAFLFVIVYTTFFGN